MEQVAQIAVGFIVVAIVLFLGIQILGGSIEDCSNLPGYNSTAPADSTDWAGTCEDAKTQTENSYNLLLVILVVIAAVAILFVLKYLY